jgi:hypothetical protein
MKITALPIDFPQAVKHFEPMKLQDLHLVEPLQEV